MRKLLVLSILGLIAGATGCNTNPCSPGWRPSCSLFGGGRQQPNQAYGYQGGYQQECCDPCGGGAVSSGAMMMAPAPVMTQAPCCQ